MVNRLDYRIDNLSHEVKQRLKETVTRLMAERGVTLADVANLVFILQSPYYPTLTLDECLASVNSVLEKREVQFALLTGITLDVCAEKGLLPEPIQTIIASDEPLYGIDEVLALGITNVYGTIGLTNFGYLDKTKLGILAVVNDNPQAVHTFLDDLVAGLAAAASARLAHNGWT
ncbi:MAG TPA: phosphatidylglycerophosphatase A [Firmicutes bacterium]|nr:phosphatidylglycerophosphatase A [Bacillota bacterium]